MNNKKKVLSDYEKNFVLNNYKTKSKLCMRDELKGASIHTISNFMKENNLVVEKRVSRKRKNGYSVEDEDFIRKNYWNLSYREIGEKLNRSEGAIINKVLDMGLKSKSDKWTINEINILKEMYPTYLNSYISQKFLPNRSSDSIGVMARKIGLKKESCRWFSKEMLIEKLIAFSDDLGRTPTCEDVINNEDMPCVTTYDRYFGNYTNACIEANLPVNICLFGKYSSSILAKDNITICLSSAELLITNFLIDNNIRFEKEKYYTEIFDEDLGYKRCDWYLTDYDVIVEYFGLSNKDYYKEKMDEKVKICKKYNKKLISITGRQHITQKLLKEKFNCYL